jgi:hypothetical protein
MHHGIVSCASHHQPVAVSGDESLQRAAPPDAKASCPTLIVADAGGGNRWARCRTLDIAAAYTAA